MREMKDSGIEWIGEIANTHKLVRLKYVAEILDEYRKPVTAQYRNQNADILYDYYGASGIIDKIDGYTIDDHVMLIGEDGANLKLRNLPLMYEVCGKAWINNHAHILKPMKNMDFYYLFYALEALDINNYITGSAQPKLNQENLKEILIPLPSYGVQKKVSSYLDTKCSEIDAIAEDIQKEISLLEDYKKSVITEAVTKGLNPDVEMKDSGIEWIGEIPKDWNVDKIKYHLKRNEPKNPGNAIVLSVYRDYGVIPKDSRDDNHNVTSEDTSKYKYVKKGQLVINKMKAWQGSLAVSDYDGIVSPAYFIYDFIDEEYNHKYFHYLVRSCYKEEFKRISGGIREGQWDLSPEGFSNTLILLPSVEEQNRILDYILQKEMEIDSLTTDKKRQLDILADYKKSLIYEYVTGKKEVPVNE